MMESSDLGDRDHLSQVASVDPTLLGCFTRHYPRTEKRAAMIELQAQGSWPGTSLILGSGLDYHRRLDAQGRGGEKLSNFAADRY